MATTAIEDYLKHIFLLQEEVEGGALIPMGELAESIGVVPGTATAMVKRLAESGLLAYEPYGGVRLTSPGRDQAIAILRRHRLIETFLVRVLGLDWSEVHDEAEELEHAMSELVLERIDAFLNYPTVDPHGDPIPSHEGTIGSCGQRTIMDCQQGERVRIARVLDQGSSFLQFVDRCGLRPGAELTIQSVDPIAGAVSLIINSKIIEHTEPVILGHPAARKLIVEGVE